MRFLPAIHSLIGVTEAAYPGVNPLSVVLNSAVFATFMMAIAFNGFNARTEHPNVFEHIGRNRNFLLVMGGIFLAQFIFVTIGGNVLRVHALTATTWVVCAIIAALVIVIDVIRKILMNKNS